MDSSEQSLPMEPTSSQTRQTVTMVNPIESTFSSIVSTVGDHTKIERRGVDINSANNIENRGMIAHLFIVFSYLIVVFTFPFSLLFCIKVSLYLFCNQICLLYLM